MNYSRHDKSHDRTKLQGTLRWAESWKDANIVVIRARDSGNEQWTIAEHDGGQVPEKKLHLVVAKDDGSFEGPDGTSKVLEGEAWVENSKKKVALFR